MNKSLLLIGQTGSGKSTLGNWLIGEEVFDTSDYSESCTSKTVIEQSKTYDFLSVIDTPGLSDSKGKDQENTKEMTEFLKIYDERNNINLVLVVINSKNRRFDDMMKKMIIFLCKVFPKHLQYNIGIAFTFYNYEKELKKHRTDDDPRLEYQEDYVAEIMKLISLENQEEVNLNPPIFFLDSKKKDKYSKIEIQRLIGWTRSLPPIQSINVCDIKYKRTETIFETKSIPKTKDGKEVIVEITYKITIGIRYDGIEETLDKKEWSKIVTYKDMQLPKLEKEDVDYESTGTWFDILHAMKAWNELKKIEKEQGYSYSFLEKMLFVIVGANVSKAESQEKFKYK